ncbi:MAG: porin family protein [Bacteroides sp.]|nr:porin family protein [Bacteroides sp.]
MKKFISVLLLAVCFCMATPAVAQMGFGVRGGLNLAKASLNSSAFGVDNRTGFFIGPMAEFTVPLIGVGMDAAVLFSQRNVEVQDHTIKQNGFEIPINLKYTIGFSRLLAVYLAAGPDFIFDLSKDKSFDKYEYELKNSYVAINLGAGIKLFHHVQFGVNYNIPCASSGKIIETGRGREEYKYKSKVWQVSMTYMF